MREWFGQLISAFLKPNTWASVCSLALQTSAVGRTWAYFQKTGNKWLADGDLIFSYCYGFHLLGLEKKIAQIGGLKWQKFIVSWLWRLEVQDQDVSKVWRWFLQRALRKGPALGLFPQLVDGHLSLESVHHLPQMCLCPNPLFWLDQGQLYHSGPTLMASP